ncbi:MAG: DNA-processing protein DprA [Acidobacteriota bacterium]
MTLHDAAVLAVAGARDRRLLASAVRLLTNRFTDDDLAAGPPPGPGETLAGWLMRRTGPRGLSARELNQRAAALLHRGASLGLTPVALGTDLYPPRLAAIGDPPALLWVRGGVAALAAPCLGVVGSRAATAHGLAMARHLAADLALAGWTIVSGLARGIDRAAHDGALAVSGRTVAVLGSGPDRIYPPEHHNLADAIAASGAVVSEFAPGTPPRAWQFPLRNRLISGLSVAVVVVEAPEKSGALITAGAALDQGRDVLVVPGAAAGGRNRGGHRLIRDGAKLVESAVDILDEVGYPAATLPEGDSAHHFGNVPEMTDFTVDDVARAEGISAHAALARLTELELSGRIQRVGGGRFVRSGSRVLP